jgi:hypothetical protein
MAKTAAAAVSMVSTTVARLEAPRRTVSSFSVP